MADLTFPPNSHCCIHCTLPPAYCICTQWPKCDLNHFALLFHPNECHKRTSTGRLLSWVSNIRTSRWHRLLNEDQAADYQDYKLVFPDKNQSKDTHTVIAQPSDKLLFIDATWQQSKKMIRQSPWLGDLPRIHIHQGEKSQFLLRRNQLSDGLATIEAVAACLFEQGRSQSSRELIEFFAKFQMAFLNARDTGLLKNQHI